MTIGSIVAKVDAGELIRRGKPIIRSTVSAFGSRGMRSIGTSISFNTENPAVARYLKQWGATRITGKINEHTRDRIRTVLERGVQRGDTYEQMGKSLARVFDVAKGSRSVAIARTEVATAGNFATKQAFKQAGVEQKEWQATQDDTTRDTHSDMDGQVRDVDEEFDSPSGASADYPGDFGVAEEDINCRCGILPKVGDRSVRGNRYLMWKDLESARAPFERQLRRAMASGFEAQRKAVMAEFVRQTGAAA
jgi:SPP1 gp7 family putative phage head morphogenesis protein